MREYVGKYSMKRIEELRMCLPNTGSVAWGSHTIVCMSLLSNPVHFILFVLWVTLERRDCLPAVVVWVRMWPYPCLYRMNFYCVPFGMRLCASVVTFANSNIHSAHYMYALAWLEFYVYHDSSCHFVLLWSFLSTFLPYELRARGY